MYKCTLYGTHGVGQRPLGLVFKKPKQTYAYLIARAKRDHIASMFLFFSNTIYTR